MEKDYSRTAFQWQLYPLLSFLALFLVAGMTFITTHIPALGGLADFFFMIYLLLIIFLSVIFALCAIPSVIFSIKAIRARESAQKVIGNLMIAGIYLAAGFYFSYHFTYRIMTHML